MKPLRLKINEIERIWLSNKAAQEYLGKSSDFFRDLRTSGRLSYYKVGKSIFYKKSDIDKMITQSKVI